MTIPALKRYVVNINGYEPSDGSWHERIITVLADCQSHAFRLARREMYHRGFVNVRQLSARREQS